jgi:hypothetical protein
VTNPTPSSIPLAPDPLDAEKDCNGPELSAAQHAAAGEAELEKSEKEKAQTGAVTTISLRSLRHWLPVR